MTVFVSVYGNLTFQSKTEIYEQRLYIRWYVEGEDVKLDTPINTYKISNPNELVDKEL